MIVWTSNNKAIADCIEIYVRGRKNREDLNEIFCWDVIGVLANGSTVLIKSCETEKQAKDLINLYGMDFDASKRALEG